MTKNITYLCLQMMDSDPDHLHDLIMGYHDSGPEFEPHRRRNGIYDGVRIFFISSLVSRISLHQLSVCHNCPFTCYFTSHSLISFHVQGQGELVAVKHQCWKHMVGQDDRHFVLFLRSMIPCQSESGMADPPNLRLRLQPIQIV